jgi:hypothetical protein
MWPTAGLNQAGVGCPGREGRWPIQAPKPARARTPGNAAPVSQTQRATCGIGFSSAAASRSRKTEIAGKNAMRRVASLSADLGRMRQCLDHLTNGHGGQQHDRDDEHPGRGEHGEIQGALDRAGSKGQAIIPLPMAKTVTG